MVRPTAFARVGVWLNFCFSASAWVGRIPDTRKGPSTGSMYLMCRRYSDFVDAARSPKSVDSRYLLISTLNVLSSGGGPIGVSSSFATARRNSTESGSSGRRSPVRR
jgi:hypothetical protein